VKVLMIRTLDPWCPYAVRFDWTMRTDSNATLGDIHAWIDELAR
jgi:hypothetical protein